MKLAITNIFILLSLGFGHAQVTVEPGCLMFEADDIEQLYILIDITNNGAEEVGLVWQFEPAADFPEDWKFEITDLKLHYNWNVGQSSTSTFLINYFEPGATHAFAVKIRSNQSDWKNTYNISGSSSGVLRLFDNTDFIDPIAETSCVVSTNKIEIEDMVIYPNPSRDMFRLINDDRISTISIFNIIGSQISKLNHTRGMTHDISKLKSGTYLLRLENQDGEEVRTLRMCKI